MGSLNKKPLVLSYCGYLNQNEFAERYLFIQRRIAHAMTREELAFLLGRVPYLIIDYEELSAIKFDITDLDLMGLVLKGRQQQVLSFDKKDGVYDISHEKRMVRVVKSEYPENIVYEFYHHWKIGGHHKPLKIVEPVIRADDFETEAINLITAELTKLMGLGYFAIRRSPLEIRDHIWATYRFKSNAWSIVFLKNIIYEWIRDGLLSVANDKGRFSYRQ